MNVLVCIKRVPATGATIVLTEDQQEIETRNLGFTISPHEECAVEEAVRLVEAYGGSSTVLTLGPAVASEQLRDALALGIDRALLLESDGLEWDPSATAQAIAKAVREQRASGIEFDLLLFGNEAANTGDYQVGVRVAHALDLPCVTGVKGLEITADRATARRESGDGWELFDVALPAVFTIKEGINLPRYPSLPGRLKAKKKPIEQMEPAGNPGGLEKIKLKTPPMQATEVQLLGSGPSAAPKISDGFKRIEVNPTMILTLIEHDHDKLNPISLEALTLARGLANDLEDTLEALLVGQDTRPLTDHLPAFGVAKVHLIQHDRLSDYAPEAWAHSMVQLIQRLAPAALVGPGTDRGNELLAHVAAILDQPMAANCTTIQPGDSYQVTRVRWGGSLLEEAKLSGEPKLFTVAPHMIETTKAPGIVSGGLETFTPVLEEKMFRVRVTERIEKSGDKISLAEARVVVGGGRGVGSAEGFGLLEELAELLGGAVGGSRVATNLGWRPHSDQIGQTGTRIAPDLYIACGISGAIQHMVGCKGAKHILVINEDREAPIFERADYAVVGDLHEVIPALIAELKR